MKNKINFSNGNAKKESNKTRKQRDDNSQDKKMTDLAAKRQEHVEDLQRWRARVAQFEKNQLAKKEKQDLMQTMREQEEQQYKPIYRLKQCLKWKKKQSDEPIQKVTPQDSEDMHRRQQAQLLNEQLYSKNEEELKNSNAKDWWKVLRRKFYCIRLIYHFHKKDNLEMDEAGYKVQKLLEGKYKQYGIEEVDHIKYV